MFLNSVLEQAELICREENVDLRTVKPVSVKLRLRTVDCVPGVKCRLRGKMQTAD